MKPKLFGIHGAPGPPNQGATFENPFRRPCLFIVTDFKPFLEVPLMFLIVAKNCEPKGPPNGAPMEPLQWATFENLFQF